MITLKLLVLRSRVVSHYRWSLTQVVLYIIWHKCNSIINQHVDTKFAIDWIVFCNGTNLKNSTSLESLEPNSSDEVSFIEWFTVACFSYCGFNQCWKPWKCGCKISILVGNTEVLNKRRDFFPVMMSFWVSLGIHLGCILHKWYSSLSSHCLINLNHQGNYIQCVSSFFSLLTGKAIPWKQSSFQILHPIFTVSYIRPNRKIPLFPIPYLP